MLSWRMTVLRSVLVAVGANLVADGFPHVMGVLCLATAFTLSVDVLAQRVES